MGATAILVAGGSGLRAGAALPDRPATPKQLADLAGRPVLAWSAATLAADSRITGLVVVHPPGLGEAVAAALAGLPARLVPGGPSRTASVWAGIEAGAPQPGSLVLIHDAARPGLEPAVLDRLFAALGADPDLDGVVPVLPGADALWRSGPEGLADPVNRTGLVRVQTPQMFRAAALLAGYAALAPDRPADDDAAVVRAAGGRVGTVAGSHRLDKITWPGDHARMEALLAPLLPATGTGFDAHRLGPGRQVTLCGVEIAHDGGLVGHSDADVAWHALCDAIYGALAEGDIGRAFPPSDPAWKGAASRVFLEHAAARVRARGGRLTHVDLTVICEAPRIGPHREAMRESTARVLGIAASRVSIKATTTERMGFTGRGEGIAALASATVLVPDAGA